MLKDDHVIPGILFSDGDPLVIQSTGGLTQLIPRDRMARSQRFGRSLMLGAEQLGLDGQAVADRVAYLRSL